MNGADSKTPLIIDLKGPLRTPRNLAADARVEGGAGTHNSIHDDTTASKLGFKGGTVAGSVHMDQFAPLLVELYGAAFFERGNLSLYFRQATIDREKVRAYARRVANAPQARVWMENERGEVIAEGTASCGAPDRNGEARKRLAQQQAGGDLRILASCKIGARSGAVEITDARSKTDPRLAAITEPMDAYVGAGKWEGAVVPMSSCVQLFRAAQSQILQRQGAVGLYGALEIQFLNGPVFADTVYLNRVETLSLSESPKTENIWWEGFLIDPKSGDAIASHLQYLRFMKSSSPLWTTARA